MHWRSYALALIAFNALGVFFVYALQRLQGVLPFNAAGMGAVSPDSAFNTAVSFVTNTNWQGYVGEATMSHLTQMLGLAVQNFLSAATGIAVAFALARGFAARGAEGEARGHIGNFWVDVTRITVWLLLPLSFAIAIFFVSQGVIQNFAANLDLSTLEAAQAVHRHGSGRFAGGDQDAGHQRRRLLQRQLGAPLREPDGRCPTSCRCWRSS